MRTAAVTLILLVAVSLPAQSVRADMVSLDDAEVIAENWISLIIHLKGTWGGEPEADICGIETLKLDGRLLGYICHIRPQGHIVVSLLEGLSPVKAYSATSSLDPDLEEGLPDLLKRRMNRLLDEVERRLGPVEGITTEALQQAVEFDLSADWALLTQDPEIMRRNLASGTVPLSYTPGQILLTSNWFQGDPYNRNCPTGSNGCTEAHCRVGCVALAAGQIMNYWRWPPYAPGGSHRYDWPNIPDTLTVNSPQAEIDATAILCREIGDQVGMKYCDDGCISNIPTEYMAAQYPDFDYSLTVTVLRRDDVDDQDEWWSEIKLQIDNEQPAQYRFTGHSIVLDGYQVVVGNRQYHMNYGWAGGCGMPDCCGSTPNTNMWYDLDQMPCTDDHFEEYMIVNIYPVNRLRGPLTGIYDPPILTIPYRYLSSDSYIAAGADFWGGQYLQFQKDFVTLTCPESASGILRFYGDPYGPFGGSLYVFNRGDYTRGFRVDEGAIAVYQGGQLLLH